MRTTPRERAEVIARLTQLGVNYSHAEQLRRIAGTLRGWFERECGTDNGCIERDEATGKPYWRYATFSHPLHRYPLKDHETGARKRLAAIMVGYKRLVAYVQTDCRGASLYLLRKGRDVKRGESLDSIYTRGVAVY